jgi:aminopeptidase N
MKIRFVFLFIILFQFYSEAQFSIADSLRGQLRPERTCYDVVFYDLNLDINFENKSITGFNKFVYRINNGFNMIQIDLFSNMQIDSIIHDNKSLKYYRKNHAVFVDFGKMQEVEKNIDSFIVYYSGIPKKAINAPWDGGFSWTKDENGKDWLGVSCEGIGASLWWPNKDHLSDEPDSMKITCTVPKDLNCISNGVLRSKTIINDKSTFDWFVSYPINNYNVTINIGDYVHFSDTFVSETDQTKLPLDFYVMPYNLEKAKSQFEQSKEVLRIFEKYLDKYPFWSDGYALIETPYLGMEHQGAIAYGNKFMPGYLGRHPEGMPDDFIILHETGHEWWGNSVSCKDHGEMWLHESFCTYMESVFMEEKYGKEAALEYLDYYGNYIENKSPILGPLNVNYDSHDADMYYKGALMLHTLRTIINNDQLWWEIIKSFYKQNRLKSVITSDFVKLVNQMTGKNYDLFFEQYLKTKSIPTLVISRKKISKNKVSLYFKWESELSNFDMPVIIKTNNKEEIIYPKCKKFRKFSSKIDKVSDIEFMFGLYEIQEID